MKLRSSPIVTAIVTAIVTVLTMAAAPFVTVASAEVLTVCANPESSITPDRYSSRPLANTIIPLSGRANTDDDALIALWQDDSGFDILVNWGERDQHSLRADGADIIGMAPSPDLVHLMVAHNDGGLEHFLFNLDANGSGELVRSAAGDGPDTAAVCVKPH